MNATILMKNFMKTTIAAAVLALTMSFGAQAGPEPLIELAQASCDQAARKVVADTGGQLLSVAPGQDGACNVTVLVPGNGNERPRKVTVTVQAN